MLLCLAPMDGITNTVYRKIVKTVFDKYWDKENYEMLLVTEFVTSQWFFHNFEKIKDHLTFDEYEKPLIVQIFGWEIERLLHIAKKLDSEFNFDWIELNIWCPSPKITKQWAWWWLLQDKKNTLDIIRTLSESIKLPFSIKTRTWLKKEDKKEQFNFLVEAAKFCDMMTIHARYLNQCHSGDVDIDFVLDLKKELWNSTKIVYNWWIWEGWQNNSEFLDKVSILDGIMIWQAAIWNPWVFTQHIPEWDEIRDIMILHIKWLLEYKWDRAVLEFRKYIWSYILGIRDASKHRFNLMQITNIDEFIKYLLTI